MRILDWIRFAKISDPFNTSFAHLPLELSDRNTRNILPCLLHAQYMKTTRDEHVLGFGLKSCDIPIC